MNFVEELKQLSETAELQHKLDRQLAGIKAKMKTAARSGYRSFGIEIFTITDTTCLQNCRAENYYSIYTIDEAFYLKELINFLNSLGFNTAEIEYIKSSSMLITIAW